MTLSHLRREATSAIIRETNHKDSANGYACLDMFWCYGHYLYWGSILAREEALVAGKKGNCITMLPEYYPVRPIGYCFQSRTILSEDGLENIEVKQRCIELVERRSPKRAIKKRLRLRNQRINAKILVS